MEARKERRRLTTGDENRENEQLVSWAEVATPHDGGSKK